ncbi:hypothetical protein QBC40DRAFT_210573 [Triangularia verruculosa]|uniref:Uncharacterized protein n=1 Tax=Triangularia verruculosa TaxID=2587418 RepID=A0AAN6X8C6_9PEZI|nr:hypothetical protein QBC40DRAFT_210573 [Triangularia verruculosa]
MYYHAPAASLHHLQQHQSNRTMNPPYYSSRAGVRGKRSSAPSTCTCRSRRRGCGRALPACPNCRRQGQESGMTSWHRGNDGRLVARGGHQRGILSVRSRKADLANKRAGHPVKKHSFILSLPRGLSLARLVRGDKSCYRQKNGDLPLSVSFPLSDGEDLEMTDLYELLVKMSLCEEEAMQQQQQQQFEALSLPCVEIDMEDEFPAAFQREATPPPESSSESESVSSSAAPSASSSLATTPEVDPQAETGPKSPRQKAGAEAEAEVKSEEIDQADEEESESKPRSDITNKAAEVSTPKLPTPSESLINILHPLHQSTPLNETDLASMLNWLLQPEIFAHLSVQSSSATASFTSRDDDGSPFPSTDHFLQIMEVISQLTAKVLMKPSSADAEEQEKSRVEITAQHLSVIMNLRLLLDYAARVLCIRSIETQNNATPAEANTNALQVA